MATTQFSNMINPEVMAEMISAKVAKKISVIPFANVDTTLEGQAGNTITIPVFGYIGDAANVNEGASIGASALTTTHKQFTIKKIAKGVDITDEAILSGYGDPVGEANRQLIMAISQKIDQDAIDALDGAAKYMSSGNKISYAGIVDAIDMFEEEYNTEKVIFVHPHQVSQLRKDADFTSADKYVNGNYVAVNGEIGKIANCRVVVSKRVKDDDSSHTMYINPIVKISYDSETEQDTSALTIFLKRNVMVETSRDIDHQINMIRASENYVVALTDESKVIKVAFKK